MANKLLIINITRWTIRILLLLVSSFWFIFSLLSGSEQMGGGIKGIILNSPNALPWLVLLIVNWVIWKYELIGGLVLIIFGLFSFFMFNVLKGNMVVFYMLVLPLISIGLVLIGVNFFQKRN